MTERYIKLVMLGEGRVGKTSLTVRYCTDEFDDSQVSTVNASYLEKKVQLVDGEDVKLAIWDTAGQEKFNALAPMYYRDAVGAIIVYDITFKESFDRVNKWIFELRQFAQKNIVVCIAGNKCDMENNRQIKKEEAEEYARNLNCKHFSTSAKANIGVDEIFKYLTQETVNKMSKKKTGRMRERKENLPGIIQDPSGDNDGEGSPREEPGKKKKKDLTYDDSSSYTDPEPAKNTNVKLDSQSTKKIKDKKSCC